MPLLLRNVIRFTNDSQKLLQIELIIENVDLKPGLYLRSDGFYGEGSHPWFFQLFLSRDNEISLWLRNRRFVEHKLSFSAMVFDKNGKPLHSHISYFNPKDVLYINILDELSKSIYKMNFPLTVMCFLITQNSEQVVVPIAESNPGNLEKISQEQELNTDKEIAKKIENDHLQELSVHLGKLLDQAVSTDITIRVDGVTMKAHKIVLRARSPVFDKMFDHDTSEAAQNEIDINDIRAPIMKDLLTFLYTGEKKDYDFDDAYDLYYAADKYEVLSLRSACRKDLFHHLKVENACQLLSLATNHGDDALKEDVLKFIKNNFKDIVLTKTFEELAKYDSSLVVLLMRNHMTLKSE